MAKEDGGPAFPAIRGIPDVEIGGMSLRDYFAGQAIVGFLPGSNVMHDHIDAMAEAAYVVADAMIKARK